MAAIETIPPCIVRHRVDPFMLRRAAVYSYSARLRNLCGGRLLNRLDIGPTALELDGRLVRFGSKADICSAIAMSALPPTADIGSREMNVRLGGGSCFDVRLLPESGHYRARVGCRLRAKSGGPVLPN